MASTPLWKLRRLAPRANRIIMRRKSDFPVLNAYEGRIIPKANAFITNYDETSRFQITWKSELAEGRGAVANLVKTTRSWLPLVKRDIPNFDSTEFIDRPTVADDVIEDANRFYDLVNDYRDLNGQPLVYQKTCLEALDVALNTTVKEVGESEAADKKYQALLLNTRTTADAFDIELQALRSTIATICSRQDSDYQKLRSQRAQFADEDDDPNAPAPPSDVQPAGPGINKPIV